MTARRLAGTVAAIIALVPLCAAASDQDDALKLAQRVASMNGFVTSTVALHALPKGLPPSIPLPKAALLGSVADERQETTMTSSGGGRSWSMATTRPLALYYDAANRDATLKAYEDTLRAAGWKHVDLGRQMPFSRGGFVLDFPQFNTWCSPGDTPTAVMIAAPKDDRTALDLSITVAAPRGMMACGDSTADRMFADAFPKSPLPTFTATTGVTIDHAGPANDGSTSGARVSSALGLIAVFESFAKQLRDAGWTPKTDAGSAGLRSQTFTKTVDAAPYVTLLTVYPLDATHYVALVDVSNLAQ
jgi:hypothetical protein